MKRLGWMFAWPALILAAGALAPAAEIRDGAGMFGAETVRKAQTELDRIEREYSVPVTVETVKTLNGKNINDVLEGHAKAANAEGVYALIARDDHKIQVLAGNSYHKHLTTERMLSIRQAFESKFRTRDYDGGLTEGVRKLDGTLAEAKAEAGGSLKDASPPARRAVNAPAAPRRPAARTSSWGAGSLIGIVLMILAALLVFRIIGALFSSARGGGNYGPGYGPGRMGGPGYGGGGPGYGPGYGGGGGGGGFMSSLFGGIGGAMAGNWLYDKMSGNHQGGYSDQAGYGAAGASGPGVTDQSAAPSEWDQSADAGGDWGAANTADAGNAGGDWGGTGGGDWGGGGGDWGGGASDGGGDWGGGGGGGDDNGGSW